MFYSLPIHIPSARRRRRLPALLLVLPGMFGLASSAFAATLTVTSAADSGPGSLRAAITAATAGDTIAFGAGAFPTSGSTVITLTTGRLLVNKSLNIQGPGAGAVTVTDGSDGIFSVTGTSAASVAVTMSGLTLAGANATNGLSNDSGGGIYSFDANLTLTGCVFSGNTVGGGGGAISSNNSTASLVNCTLSGNTAGGGGAINANNSAVSLTSCTLSGNTASAGGAIFITGSTTGNTMSLTNCTLLTNTTMGGGGGGIYNSGTQLILTSCTLAGNTASSSQTSPGQGGGLYSTGAASVQSCIISGNTAGGAGPDVYGSVTSGGSNLLSDQNGAAYGFTGPHDLVGQNPLLASSLANNGGPTQTVAVLIGSPAIGGDYADATTTDQRGVTRTAARHTIGAFEYNSFHTHLLWTNTDGTAAIWTIAPDGSFTSTPGYGPISGWTARSIADGTDGKTRLLWTRSDGMNSVWTVNDATGSYTSTPGYGPYDGGKWNVTSLSVGPDNLTRLQWKHSPDGMSSVWTVAGDGSFTSTPGYGPYASTPGDGAWTASALAVGGDSLSRLLWNDGGGRFAVWTVAGDGTFASTPAFGPISGWMANAIASGPDSNAHLLLNRSDGGMAVWTVNGGGFQSSTPLYGPIPSWNCHGLAVGQDTLPRVLWSRTDGMSSVWTISGDGSYASTPGYGPYSGWNTASISVGQ